VLQKSKVAGPRIFAKIRNGKKSPIRITSIALPKSPMSLTGPLHAVNGRGRISCIGRPYETQNDFGSWRAADDGLTGGVVSSPQHAVPWHGDPRTVDYYLVAVGGEARQCPPTICH
jgi:hypothetical protein